MKVLSLAVALASLTACHNYTAAPICTDANAVAPPGLTGVYTLSVQNADFSVETSEISVGIDTAGRMRTRGAKDDSEQESRVCQVGGFYVQERFNDTVKAYAQSRFYVTGMGLTTMELFYDKTGLDAAGVASKVFEVPEDTATILGPVVTAAVERVVAKAARLLQNEQPTLGLLIDNAATSPEGVMAHAHALPAGLTLLRK